MLIRKDNTVTALGEQAKAKGIMKFAQKWVIEDV